MACIKPRSEKFDKRWLFQLLHSLNHLPWSSVFVQCSNVHVCDFAIRFAQCSFRLPHCLSFQETTAKSEAGRIQGKYKNGARAFGIIPGLIISALLSDSGERGWAIVFFIAAMYELCAPLVCLHLVLCCAYLHTDGRQHVGAMKNILLRAIARDSVVCVQINGFKGGLWWGLQ